MDIWKTCNGEKHIKPTSYKGFRVVESQHYSSTRKLVGSHEEHAILELLIDELAKPPIPNEWSDKDYLLYTPFRYPSPHSSRFRKSGDIGIFYGSEELSTALAESAYYSHFRVLMDSEMDFQPISKFMTSFAFKTKSDLGIDLTSFPFDKYEHIISQPNEYRSAQAIGTAMQKANVEVFRYKSVRCPNSLSNIGIFNINAFVGRSSNPKEWHCYADKDYVEFFIPNKESHVFEKSMFL